MSYIITVLNPLIAGWVLYMPRLDFFFNTSRWHRVTVLPIFFYFFAAPWHKIIVMQRVFFFSMLYVCKAHWTILYPR